MVFVKAFVIGGLICAAVQILMEKTKLMPGRIMVLLVCSGVVLGAVGLYEPILELRELGHQCHFLDLAMFYGKELNRQLTNLVFLGFSKAGLPHVP